MDSWGARRGPAETKRLVDDWLKVGEARDVGFFDQSFSVCTHQSVDFCCGLSGFAGVVEEGHSPFYIVAAEVSVPAARSPVSHTWFP